MKHALIALAIGSAIVGLLVGIFTVFIVYWVVV